MLAGPESRRVTPQKMGLLVLIIPQAQAVLVRRDTALDRRMLVRATVDQIPGYLEHCRSPCDDANDLSLAGAYVSIILRKSRDRENQTKRYNP